MGLLLLSGRREIRPAAVVPSAVEIVAHPVQVAVLIVVNIGGFQDAVTVGVIDILIKDAVPVFVECYHIEVAVEVGVHAGGLDQTIAIGVVIDDVHHAVAIGVGLLASVRGHVAQPLVQRTLGGDLGHDAGGGECHAKQEH